MRMSLPSSLMKLCTSTQQQRSGVSNMMTRMLSKEKKVASLSSSLLLQRTFSLQSSSSSYHHHHRKQQEVAVLPIQQGRRNLTTTTSSPSSADASKSKGYTMVMLKQLREKSGAPVVECKKALEAVVISSSGSDNHDDDSIVNDAMDWLREYGAAKITSKVSGRTADEGLVGLSINDNGTVASMIKLSSETDFASQSTTFTNLVSNITSSILRANNNNNNNNDTINHSSSFHNLEPSDILPLSLLSNDDDTAITTTTTNTIDEALKEAIISIRENVSISSATLVNVPKNNNGDDEIHNLLVGYVHGSSSCASNNNTGTAAAVVQLSYNNNNDNTETNNNMKELGKKLAMHIVAAKPLYLTADKIPQDMIEKERGILTRKLMEEEEDAKRKKPPQIIEKIINGKLRKFYESICLQEQNHMIENENPKINKFFKLKGVTIQGFKALWI